MKLPHSSHLSARPSPLVGGTSLRKGLIIAGIIGVVIAAGCWAYAWFFGYLPNHVEDLTLVSIEPFNSPATPENLQLRFRSNINLRKFSEDSGAFGAYANFSLCPFHTNPWVGIGRVEHNGIDLDTKPIRTCEWHYGKFAGCSTSYDTPQVRAELANRNQTGLLIYSVSFVYDGQQMENYQDKFGGLSARKVPLPGGPQDLCVRIHGDGGPPGYVSNEFRIPKAALVQAIKAATMPPDYSRGRR
jgi:hypothetical protein